MEKVLLWEVNGGIAKACPLVVSELTVAPVCVNTAALPPLQGPLGCVVGAFPELTSAPSGVGALSAYGLAASNA